MDYFETFFTLIDIMAEAYYKLLVGTEGPICTQAYFELVLKCDGKFKVSKKEARFSMHMDQPLFMLENRDNDHQGA